MIFSGHCRNQPLKSILAMMLIMAVIALFSVGSVWGASESGHDDQAVASESHGGGEQAGESHGGEHGEGLHWMATDWYRISNFAVLAIALFILLRKPISQALNNRIKGIRDDLADLEARKATIEKQLDEYNEKLASLEKEAEQVIEGYIRQGEEAKARILKEAEGAAEKLKEQAKKNIAHEFGQAKLYLQAEIVEKALAKAEKMIKDQIAAEDQSRLVDEYLEKVGA